MKTRQYWFCQPSRLMSMVDTLGLPTIKFFTHSAADLQWPKLAHLICPDPESRSSCTTAVIENPAIADWFSHGVQKFIDAFYHSVLGATDYWLRFEWQHRAGAYSRPYLLFLAKARPTMLAFRLVFDFLEAPDTLPWRHR